MNSNVARRQDPWHFVVQNLLQLLETSPDLSSHLMIALKNSKRFEEPLLESYCYLVHRMQTTIPNPTDWLPMNLEFYYVLACSENNYLAKHNEFMEWVRLYVESIGTWMDSPDSVKEIETFYNHKLFTINDYVAPPGGWKTYNQFFSRQIKSGARQIDEIYNDRIISSAADSSFCGHQKISAESTVIAKGISWSISELLAGSAYADSFANGWYGHSFLAPHNYHRFHTPVKGSLIELRRIMGKVTMDVHLCADNTLSVSRAEIGYQFQQERGLAIIDSPLGLVAVIPIGMGIVSSVNFSAVNNAWLEKGAELGFFSFGGSDVVLLFQKQASLDWLVEEGDVIRQGQSIAISRY